MIERLIENWLASAGERGFEVPFAQLLSAEDYRVVQGPVHHPYEHGKDILAYGPSGELAAFQLKGPDLLNLEDFERIQGQLLALAGTAVTHPSVTPPRRPDRVFLVTTATLTPPVRDRLEKFNLGNQPSGWAPIEPVEREQLLSRFLAGHGRFLPQTLPDLRTLIELYYSDPTSLFPVRAFARYLNALLPFPPATASVPECRRAIASATLLTGYAASQWTRADNHLCVAQAWLTACITILRFAASRELAARVWSESYALAFEAARVALSALAEQSAEAEDLVVPDLVEGFVYPSRALLVSGFLAAHFLSETALNTVQAPLRAQIRSVLSREARFAKITGECDSAAWMLVSSALEQLGEIRTAEVMILSLAATLSSCNQRHSSRALPDPYHDTEQVLMHQIGADSDLGEEEFDGRSYTLHVAIEWLARRLWRQHLARMWRDISEVEFLEFQPSTPDRYLAPVDDEGELRMWWADRPQSWAALLAKARTFEVARLPPVLMEHREMLPYLALLFPYRLTSTLAHAIDMLGE